jgi:hypothetical protein
VAVTDKVKGRTAAFATFSPFRSFKRRLDELVVFSFAPTNNKAVREREFLHYAYFSNVTPRALARAGIAPTGALKHGALLFISAYNGDPEVYFRGFSDDLNDKMDRLWEGCVDWETAKKYRNLDRFIRTYRRDIDMFFDGYGDRAVGVRRSLKFRTGLDRLLRAARSAESGAAFAEAYAYFVQLIWGNPARKQPPI